ELLEDATGKKLILVDHNEKEQRVNGKYEILEIIDHHKFDFSYPVPIFILNKPLGSTSTIIAEMFFEKNFEIPREIAGLLISGILSDTVIFKSPTTTERDKEIANKLNKIVGLELIKYGKEMKKKGANIEGLSIRDLIFRDFKEYNFNGKKVGIGQLELIETEEFLEKKNEIIEEMKKIKEDGFDSIIFAVTDIMKEGSTLFCVGENELVGKAFGVDFSSGYSYLQGIMSRKKQIVPPLEKIFS
ncbi:MAG TPA: manganese-dependent inorganic pyrophosphatase, partial [Candidatus Aenigmarchaeota archaeon]|nr:manganese-dependent inorganic pyrophosphatase [Candidatus Aenigmarchaeota archaeon]